jgi:hypothetical protein
LLTTEKGTEKEGWSIKKVPVKPSILAIKEMATIPISTV